VIAEFDGKRSRNRTISPDCSLDSVGKAVTVKILRSGKMIDQQVKVGEMEEKREMASAPIHKPSE